MPGFRKGEGRRGKRKVRKARKEGWGEMGFQMERRIGRMEKKGKGEIIKGKEGMGPPPSRPTDHGYDHVKNTVN